MIDGVMEFEIFMDQRFIIPKGRINGEELVFVPGMSLDLPFV